VKCPHRISFVAKGLLDELPAFGVHHGYGLLSCMQIPAYNFHLGLLRPEPFLVGYRKSLLGPLRGRRRYDISLVWLVRIASGLPTTRRLAGRFWGCECNSDNHNTRQLPRFAGVRNAQSCLVAFRWVPSELKNIDDNKRNVVLLIHCNRPPPLEFGEHLTRQLGGWLQSIIAHYLF
jgi:hypothetical protein